ncbi:Retrovirus-related Pol polyprotein transposon TNT 1-94 like [Verticillium longisporum]|nr:Retrovirus-related Pol polyprotein transposon TNT 1-94 like [Verticillium longisporum]
MDSGKLRVILTRREEWRTWLNSVRAVASSYEVWDLVDPDKEADSRPKRAKKPTAPSLEDETRDLSTQLTLYKIHLDIYNRESAGLQEVQKYILNTVDRSLSAVFMNEESSQEWLKALKDHFAPSDMGQKQYIRQRWEEHMSMIKKMDHEKWVDDFILLCIDVEKHGIPQLKEAADQNIQFLRAILSVSPGEGTGAETSFYNDSATFIGKDRNGQSAQRSVQDSPRDSPQQSNSLPARRLFCDCVQQKRAPKACQPICLCPNIAEHRRKKSYQPDQSLLDYIDEAKKGMKPSTLQFWNEKIKEDKKKQQEAKGTSGAAVSAFNNSFSNDDARSYEGEYTNYMSNFSLADSDEFQQTTRGGDLRHEFLIDSGTPNHITNNKDLLSSFREATDTVRYRTGGGKSNPVEGYGTMTIETLDSKQNVIRITCHDVSYIRDYPTTLVSARQLQRQGLGLDSLRSMLFNPASGSEIPLQEKGGQYAVNTLHSITSFYHSKKQRAAMVSDSRLWHERLAHAHPEAIQQLQYSCIGVGVKGPTTFECESCGVAKSKRIVSRRQPTYTTTDPFERVNLDFFSPGRSYNGMESCLVITDAYSGKIVVRILPARADGFQAFINFEMFLWRQYQLVIKVLRVDWDSALRSNLVTWSEERGILLERSAARTPEQNGAAERNGGTIFTIARTLTSAAGFPEDLWPEVVQAAAYLHNLTPKGRLQWATPEGKLNDWLNSKGLAARTTAPGLAHLRRYGCRAYPLTADAQHGRNRKQKLAPRAHIGYLCGYDSSNIYRIWVPEMKAVLRTRDVGFDESTVFKDAQAPKPILQDEFQALDVPVADAQNPFNSSLDIDEFDIGTIDLFERARTFQLEGKINAEIRRPGGVRAASRDDVLPSPRPTPETATGQGQPAASEGVEDAVGNIVQGAEEAADDPTPGLDTIQMTDEAIQDTIEVAQSPESTPQYTPADQSSAEDETETVEARPLIARRPAPQPSPSTQIQGTRRSARDRKPSQFKDGTPTDQALGARGSRKMPPSSHVAMEYSFFHTQTPSNKKPLLRTDMPAEPRSWKEMLRSGHKKQWLEASVQEVNTIEDMGTIEQVPFESVDQEVHKVLGLTWVWKYKVDSAGYVTKFKARLCVRGDQQPKNEMETYASTLAAKTFRTLMAICAEFDLDTHQLDAVNAFPNAHLDETVYVWAPQGWGLMQDMQQKKDTSQRRTIFKLKRALYGLRRSPLLWHKLLSEAMRKIGLVALEEDNCVFMGKGMIVFFYVDDIILMNRKEDRQAAEELKNQLKSLFEMRELGEVRWFLGIRVIRDRSQRKLWLSLENYITEKMKDLNLQPSTRGHLTPLSSDPAPAPKDYEASAESIHLYQRKIGSINYAATTARPDVAKAASRLAESLLRPTEIHHLAADHCLRYLYRTRTLSPSYGGSGDYSPSLYCASDASFGDDPITRFSSQGYTTMLFGGPIDWKATKQRSVVTSSTEAELVALSVAARNYIATRRLLKELQLRFSGEIPIQMFCDNRQTLSLLTSERPQATTKLKHVDIHRLWIRQTVRQGKVSVDWVSTDKMVSDGLTKILTAQKHQNFVQLLNMECVPAVHQ